MPIFAAPRASTALFSLGGTSQGAIDRRASIRAKYGASSADDSPSTPCSFAHCRSVTCGVRNELVQLTVVLPPTQRPCRMPIALSAVLRPADSW